jgi:hypothetical protein
MFLAFFANEFSSGLVTSQRAANAEAFIHRKQFTIRHINQDAAFIIHTNNQMKDSGCSYGVTSLGLIIPRSVGNSRRRDYA